MAASAVGEASGIAVEIAEVADLAALREEWSRLGDE